MPSEEPSPRKKLPWVPLAILAAAALAGAVLVLRGVDLHVLVERGMGVVRNAGPWAFFAGIALLPAVGAPLLAFTVTAGEAFSPLMTMPGVIAATMAAIAANLALTYWLARYALRPFLTGLSARYGYTVPRVSAENALSVALVVRLTPGPPFFMQSYLLGLAEVPFRMYMIVSWLCILPWSVGAIVLGKGVFKGDFKMVGVGVGVLVAAAAFVHWLRKRYASRAR